jgi:hypothetical protein
VLSIETHVRETEIRLFGFASDLEREWFRLLLVVQGVGAKVALAVLSTLKASDLASAIALGDKATIARAPGVGPKVAARICAELKDKAPAMSGIDLDVARFQADLGDKIAPQAGGGGGLGACQSGLWPVPGFGGDRSGDARGGRGGGDGRTHPCGAEGAEPVSNLPSARAAAGRA